MWIFVLFFLLAPEHCHLTIKWQFSDSSETDKLCILAVWSEFMASFNDPLNYLSLSQSCTLSQNPLAMLMSPIPSLGALEGKIEYSWYAVTRWSVALPVTPVLHTARWTTDCLWSLQKFKGRKITLSEHFNLNLKV